MKYTVTFEVWRGKDHPRWSKKHDAYLKNFYIFVVRAGKKIIGVFKESGFIIHMAKRPGENKYPDVELSVYNSAAFLIVHYAFGANAAYKFCWNVGKHLNVHPVAGNVVDVTEAEVFAWMMEPKYISVRDMEDQPIAKVP